MHMAASTALEWELLRPHYEWLHFNSRWKLPQKLSLIPRDHVHVVNVTHLVWVHRHKDVTCVGLCVCVCVRLCIQNIDNTTGSERAL